MPRLRKNEATALSRLPKNSFSAYFLKTIIGVADEKERRDVDDSDVAEVVKCIVIVGMAHSFRDCDYDKATFELEKWENIFDGRVSEAYVKIFLTVIHQLDPSLLLSLLLSNIEVRTGVRLKRLHDRLGVGYDNLENIVSDLMEIVMPTSQEPENGEFFEFMLNAGGIKS